LKPNKKLDKSLIKKKNKEERRNKMLNMLSCYDCFNEEIDITDVNLNAAKIKLKFEDY